MKAFALCLALFIEPAPRYSPEVADAILQTYLDTEAEIPGDLPVEIGEALVRFWHREQLWGAYPAPHGWHLVSEIRWTRQRLATDLPRLDELRRLPTLEYCQASLKLLAAMRSDLDAMAPLIPEWNSREISLRQFEIGRAEYFFSLVQSAHTSQQLGYQRERLAEIRSRLRPADWHSGNWPTVPYWQIPRKDFP